MNLLDGYSNLGDKIQRANGAKCKRHWLQHQP